MGDGAELADGTYLNPIDSGMECPDERTTVAYYEVGLPEGYAPGETVEFVLTVFSPAQGEGPMERISVPVTLPVTSARAITGEGTADGYAAKAELYISDVDISGSVRIEAPEDYVPEGYVLEADGVTYPNIGGGFRYADGVHEVMLRFDLPQSMETMTLVPEDRAYAHEAVELKGE